MKLFNKLLESGLVFVTALMASMGGSTAFDQSAADNRVVEIDGQTLDPAIQSMLAADYARGSSGDDDGASAETAEGRAIIRQQQTDIWSSRTAEPPEMEWVRDAAIETADASIPVRIYRPDVDGVLPTIVYYHGGGWFIGGIEASDRSMRQLAHDAKTIVISVEYRLSPETTYPAAWNDAEAAFLWGRQKAQQFGGAPDQVCVGGDSAGGNMSIVVTMRQLDKGEPAPLCQVLYYPAVDNRDVDTMRETYRSSVLFGQGFMLDREFTDYILPLVFPGEDLAQAEISPLFDKARVMPPTLIATAGFDPLRDSGRAYAAKLIGEGNDVIYLEYSSLIHGFTQHTAVTSAAIHAARQSAEAAGKMARDAVTARSVRSAPGRKPSN
ncbi:MAG: alpha/beta hydrolase [Pseudomonadota bacterium]